MTTRRGKKEKLRLYTVFLSHSSSDAWIAKTMAEKIEALGASCWLDEKDFEGGDIVADEIIKGIDACNEAIVLVSPNTIKSQWVSFEVGGLRVQRKRITPILNNVLPSELAPMHDIKGVDLNRFDQFLAQLARRLPGNLRRRKE